jgi:hypothetical protein
MMINDDYVIYDILVDENYRIMIKVELKETNAMTPLILMILLIMVNVVVSLFIQLQYML